MSSNYHHYHCCHHITTTTTTTAIIKLPPLLLPLLSSNYYHHHYYCCHPRVLTPPPPLSPQGPGQQVPTLRLTREVQVPYLQRQVRRLQVGPALTPAGGRPALTPEPVERRRRREPAELGEWGSCLGWGGKVGWRGALSWGGGGEGAGCVGEERCDELKRRRTVDRKV